MQLAVAEKGDQVEVDERTFGADFNEPLIHQVVTAYLAGGRRGSRAHKTRAMVRGGGGKPWRQKGTGRARAGSIRSPIWRGGGVTFAARPNNYSQKVNRKSYRGALRSILSELVRQERLVVFEEFTVSEPKTKDLARKLKGLELENVLIVTGEQDINLELSARNLHQVQVQTFDDIDPVSLIAFEKVVLTVPALRRIEERLA